MRKIAVCPGSFDPITLGHLDIIERAASLFEKVIVLVSFNTQKNPSFSVEERIGMINAVIKDMDGMDNVVVDCWDGLLADYLKDRKATAIVKGLRAVTDFEYEFSMALANKKLYDSAETVFLTTSEKNLYLSSSLVKEIARFGGDISSFVPAQVHDIITDRLKRNK